MIETTVIIIAITIFISFTAWSQPNLMANWIFSPYNISQRKQWHRFATSGFLHANYLHLGFNMISLYFFGKDAEQGFLEKYGHELYRYFYIIFYISAIVFSHIPVYFRHKRNPSYRALGASGAVSAVIFMTVIMNPEMKLMIFPIPIRFPGIVFAILYVLYSAYMSKNARDNIGHEAHLYGSLYGLVFVGVMMPERIVYFMNNLPTFF
jgi:membrane associated rhomboid family serine protease